MVRNPPDSSEGAAPAPRRRAPTMEDVATRAGVSRALVSIVFRDQPGASQATRGRVREAAAALGYAPDQRARLLSRSRSRLIGVVFGLQQEFQAELVEALYSAAGGGGYEVAISGSAPSRAESAAVAGLLAYRCEALVLLGPALPTADLAALAARLPTVVVARHVDAPALDVVRTDDVAGARLAVEHLLGLGHRRIAYLSGGKAGGDAERRRGYRQALRSGGPGHAPRVLPAGLTEQAGARAVRRLLDDPDGGPPSTALLAFNDRCALGALTTLRDRGARVPDQVSVVGYDDSPVARLPWVALTTIRQDTGLLASHAVHLATSRIERPEADAREQVVPPKLVRRRTTAPPPDV